MIEQLDDFLELHQIYCEHDVSLKEKTWIHRGGKVKYFIVPLNMMELKNVCTFLFQNKLQFEVIGHTSNIYFLNEYNPPIVVSTRKCNKVEYFDDYILCECGASVMYLARECVKKGICGFEYLTDLPGTVGAAVYNNSSCKSNSISSLLLKVEFLTETGSLLFLEYDDLQFSFRDSALKRKEKKGVILRVFLRKKHGDTQQLEVIAKQNHEERLIALEGPWQNLGCTVNRPFINGKMPFHYRSLLLCFNGITLGLGIKKTKRMELSNKFILLVTGNKKLIPYVSHKLVLTFIWRDEKADELFPCYMQFMSRIYKTDRLEIEIKKGYGKN